MFIELTDHLRCPGDHDEAYLVLLPDEMDGRAVRRGVLGCPVCGWATTVQEGVVDFGGGGTDEPGSALTAGAILAFLGLSGPGGYVALAGAAGSEASALAQLMPGVRIIAVNPPSTAVADQPASVLRAGRWPIKEASVRGVALAGSAAAEAAWVTAAARSVLPGLRIAVAGPRVDLPGFQLLATTDSAWVAVRK
ncbi:MAG TPA: hypothetical protein VF862_05105 [Gemmatimonadales bacterium]